MVVGVEVAVALHRFAVDADETFAVIFFRTVWNESLIERFEVDGADAASRFLLANEYPKSKAELVWDAIALHSAADIADRKQPEVALIFFGAHVDVMGLRIEEITPSLIDDTLALYPRIGMKAAFTEALAEVARKKPHTAIGTGLADIGRRLVHGLEIPNVCDVIHAAPFDS